MATIPWYLPGYKGGGCIRALANTVDQLGHEFAFRVITRDRDIGDDRRYKGTSRKVWQWVSKSQVLYLCSREGSFLYLYEILKKNDFDVLYINSFFSYIFTIKPLFIRRLGLLKKVPIVLAPRGELSAGALALKGIKKKTFIFLARMIGLYDNIIWQATSEFEAEDIKKIMGPHVNIRIAPDIPPTPPECFFRKEKATGKLNIIFLSRITRVKNLQGALNLLRELSGTVVMNIFGPIEDQEYWDRCVQIMKELPPNITVKYQGMVEHSQVNQLMQEHDLFFLPTFGENYGYVILEALLAGCPVLISDKTPWRNLQEKGIGWDISLENTLGFCNVLQQVIDMDGDTHEQLSRRAFSYGQVCSRNPTVLDCHRKLFLTAVEDGNI